MEITVTYFSINMGGGVMGTGNSDGGLVNGNTVGSDHWQMLGTSIVDNWGTNVSSSISDWRTEVSSSISDWGSEVSSSHDGGITVTYFSFDMSGSMMSTGNGYRGLIYWNTISSNDREMLGTSIVGDWGSNMGGVSGNWSNTNMSEIPVAGDSFNMGNSVFSLGDGNGWFIYRYSVSSNHGNVLGSGVMSDRGSVSSEGSGGVSVEDTTTFTIMDQGSVMMESTVAYFSIYMGGEMSGLGGSNFGGIKGHRMSSNGGSKMSSISSDGAGYMSSVGGDWSSNNSGITVTYFSLNMGGGMVGTGYSNSGLIYWDTIGSDDWEMLGPGIVASVTNGSSNS